MNSPPAGPSTYDCPNATHSPEGMRCAILPAGLVVPGVGHPGNPCAGCREHWRDGKPPAATIENPFLHQVILSRYHVAGMSASTPAGSTQKPAGPTIAEKAASFATALFRWAVDDSFALTEQQVYDRRLAICRSCPYLDGMNCGLCGCNTQAKLSLPSSVCPASPPKWGAVARVNQIPK